MDDFDRRSAGDGVPTCSEKELQEEGSTDNQHARSVS